MDFFISLKQRTIHLGSQAEDTMRDSRIEFRKVFAVYSKHLRHDVVFNLKVSETLFFLVFGRTVFFFFNFLKC